MDHLTPAQQRLLEAVAHLNRGDGWVQLRPAQRRTAQVLAREGLVELTDVPPARAARITDRGQALLTPEPERS